MHIAVVGLGPAGALLAHRAAQRNWTVDAYDPRCELDTGEDGRQRVTLPRWRNTYGVFLRDLPRWAQEVVVPVGGNADSAGTAGSDVGDLAVFSPRRRVLTGRPYLMIDRDAMRQALCPEDSAVVLHRRRVDVLDPEVLGVDVVVDCRGAAGRVGDIRQVAFGVVVDGDPPVGPVFMDWRAVPGCPEVPSAVPSFLYVQPVDGGVLLEETVLATRAPVRQTLEVLKERLAARCAGRIEVGDVRETEIVAFPTDRRRRAWYTGVRDGVAVYGAAGGLTHPATGYSVAASAAAADEMLDLIRDGRLRMLRRFSAAGAYWLRLFGAELVVASDGPTLRRFFDAFFRLPGPVQQGYLSGQSAAAVAVAMISLARFPRRTLPFLRPVPRVLAGAVRDAVRRVVIRG